MDDNRTMAQLLEAPTVGYEDAIVVPENYNQGNYRTHDSYYFYFSIPKVVERETEVTKDTVPPTNNGSTKDVQPPGVQVQPHVPNSEPAVAPVSAPMPNLKPSFPYPSRRNYERRRKKANDQIEKFYEIFKDLSFEVSLADALILMPKFALTLKNLIGNKEKLSEMARTPLNEHYRVIFPEWKSA
ncbi:hypothetical protein Tco_0953721 [Tanacetum coccineum]|uniref:Reverse transcriptase domain-containing protein n=1 Tax=Tanacetum coccineum TaxID=301880 RepID=A0ABQ5E0P5_9ASTR